MSNLSLVQIEVAPSNAYIFSNTAYADAVFYPTYESQKLLFGTKSNVNAGLVIGSSNIAMTLQPVTSNNSISFYAGNSNLLMTILGSGNVGIGKTYPQYPLDIVGNINFTGALMQNGSAYIGSQWSNNGSSIFITGSNVGIGTTSPQQLLHVAGNLQVDSNLYLSNTKLTLQGLVISRNTSSNGPVNVSTVITSVPGYTWNSNVVINASNSNYSVSTQIGGTEYMRVNGNGNVGIGTTTPAYSLDVAGDVRFGALQSTITYNQFDPYGNITNNRRYALIAQATANSGHLRIHGVMGGDDASTCQGRCQIDVELNSRNGTINGKISNEYATMTGIVVYRDTSNNFNVYLTGGNYWKANLILQSAPGQVVWYNPPTWSTDAVWSTPSNNTLWFDSTTHMASSCIESFFYMNTANTPVNIVTNLTSGNVGIGTVSPAYKLDVNGVTRLGGQLWFNGGNQTIDQMGSYAILFGYNTPKTTSGGVVVQIHNNSTDRYPLFCAATAGTSSGTNGIGINTSSPAYTLDVNGTTHVSGSAYINQLYGTTTTQATNDTLYIGPVGGNVFLDRPSSNGQFIIGYNTPLGTAQTGILQVYNGSGGSGASAKTCLFTVTSAGTSSGGNYVNVNTYLSVGTSSAPSYPLDVSGTLRATNIINQTPYCCYVTWSSVSNYFNFAQAWSGPNSYSTGSFTVDTNRSVNFSSGSGSSFTPPVAGLWQVDALVGFPTSSGSFKGLSIVKNGSGVGNQYYPSGLIIDYHWCGTSAGGSGDGVNRPTITYGSDYRFNLGGFVQLSTSDNVALWVTYDWHNTAGAALGSVTNLYMIFTLIQRTG